MSICFAWFTSGSSMCHSSWGWSIASGSSCWVSKPDAAERSALSCSVQTDEEDWLCKLCPVRDLWLWGTHTAVYLLRGPALLLNSYASTGWLMAFLWRSILSCKLVLLYKVHGCFLAEDQRCVFRVQLCGDRFGPKHAHLFNVECNCSSSYCADCRLADTLANQCRWTYGPGLLPRLAKKLSITYNRRMQTIISDSVLSGLREQLSVRFIVLSFMFTFLHHSLHEFVFQS